MMTPQQKIDVLLSVTPTTRAEKLILATSILMACAVKEYRDDFLCEQLNLLLAKVTTDSERQAFSEKLIKIFIANGETYFDNDD